MQPTVDMAKRVETLWEEVEAERVSTMQEIVLASIKRAFRRHLDGEGTYELHGVLCSYHLVPSKDETRASLHAIGILCPSSIVKQGARDTVSSLAPPHDAWLREMGFTFPASLPPRFTASHDLSEALCLPWTSPFLVTDRKASLVIVCMDTAS